MKISCLPLLLLFMVATGLAADIRGLARRDCERYEDYAVRLSIVYDSLSAVDKKINDLSTAIKSQMPPLAPRGEFEKTVEFEKRKADYELAVRNSSGGRIDSLLDVRAEFARIFNVIGSIQKKVLSLDSVGFVSPFSTKDEIDLKVLLKISSNNVFEYNRRMSVLMARVEQTDKEKSAIRDSLIASYPPFDERGEAEPVYRERKRIWKAGLDSLCNDLFKRCSYYRQQLIRGFHELEKMSESIREEALWAYVPNAVVVLREYDSESESFNFSVYDTLNTETPFLFQGQLFVPIDKARNMDRVNEKFDVRIAFYNDPLNAGQRWIYPGMIRIEISHSELDVSAKGSFVKLDFTGAEGYEQWERRIARYQTKSKLPKKKKDVKSVGRKW